MYNSNTERRIKDLPQIGDINLDRLPQDLTRIYAQIVSLRRQVADGTINFQDEELTSNLTFLRRLADNLETILLTYPNHEKKDSIGFVAGTANALIFRMRATTDLNDNFLEENTISPYLASVVLFLIGNSQPDAAEMADALTLGEDVSAVHRNLVTSIVLLSKGRLLELAAMSFPEGETLSVDLELTALNFLWVHISMGLKAMALRLTGGADEQQYTGYFDRVINLALTDENNFKAQSGFFGPYRLSKLLKILEADVYTRSVINIPTPSNVNPIKWSSFLKKLTQERPFLWENHKPALETNFLNQGKSGVLTFPTGAGKTTLSELKIASALYSGKKVVYLVPTHALKDQVNRTLKHLFEDTVDNNFEIDAEFTEMLEGDSSLILVMTPERCLTLINISPEFFSDVGLIAFDEFHLIHGVDLKKDRRALDAMYCLLQLFTLAPFADYLLISAMVENGDEIREWIENITGRECYIFNSTWKPTRQLHGCIVFDKSRIEELDNLIEQEKAIAKTKTPSQRLKKEITIMPECIFSLRNIWETKKDGDYFRTKILDKLVRLSIGTSSGGAWYLTSNRNKVAATLAAHFSNLNLKTLIFVDDPKICISTANEIQEKLSNLHNDYEAFIATNVALVTSLTKELGGLEYSYFNGNKNIGVHHGLLLPAERHLTELYFKNAKGSIALVATATLAQGINLPAEIVIIAGDDRYDETEEKRIQVKPHELLNAAGRAGRAGLSSQGAVLLIPGDIVTIEGQSISNKWWELKDRVFSKGDQCLKIEDPLEYFLDSLQESASKLESMQIHFLYRFKAERQSENNTKQLLGLSLFAFRAKKANQFERFDGQVNKLIQRRVELDDLTEDIAWTKEISYKSGVDPSTIMSLSKSIDEEDFEEFIAFTVSEFLVWFFNWLKTDDLNFIGLFTKQTTINELKRIGGLTLSRDYPIEKLLNQLDKVVEITKLYIAGKPLKEIDDAIGNSSDVYLTKVRSFVLRLIPEVSFAIGLLSMVVTEKAKQRGIQRNDLPLAIRLLASCIKEGFDSPQKLIYKKNNDLAMRVETHELFQANINGIN
ncbi:MAG: DEAD/DEAH box helicase [Bacteroidetes bacterium]|nr:DEAD/DEAH box helicase [Bacteroidota bacterium]